MMGGYEGREYYGESRIDSLDRAINAALTAQSRRADAEHKQQVELSKPMTMGAINGYFEVLAKYEGGGIPDIRVLGTIELRAERTLQEEREGSKVYKATQRLVDRLHNYRASRAAERKKDDYITPAEVSLREMQARAGEVPQGNDYSGSRGSSLENDLSEKPSVGSVIHVRAKRRANNEQELITRIRYNDRSGDTVEGTLFIRSPTMLTLPWEGDVEVIYAHPERPIFNSVPAGSSAATGRQPDRQFHRPY